MARIKLPSYIKEGHGRMDDAVIVTRNGESYMKVYRKTVSNSEEQAEVRQAFKTLVADWKFLSGVVRESWNLSTHDTNASGYNAFMGANIRHRRAGEPLDLCKGSGEEILMNFTAEPASSAGGIVCSFLPPEAGRHIAFFTRKETKPGVNSVITRHDAGAGAASPFTVNGLDAGEVYSVYAVVTDYQYENALIVSQSVAAVAAAGV